MSVLIRISEYVYKTNHQILITGVENSDITLFKRIIVKFYIDRISF
jgi:hypothetical protein